MPETAAPRPHEEAEARRRVVSFLISTADGVVEEPSDWISEGFDEDTHAHFAALLARQDQVILGRRTYEEWHRFWPSATLEPFASFINNVEKHVASRTLTRTEWCNCVPMPDVDAGLAALRAAPGGDIGVHGSIELTRSLILAAQVDELVLYMVPVLRGGGDRLLDGHRTLQGLALEEVHRSRGGVLMLTYRIERPDIRAGQARAT